LKVYGDSNFGDDVKPMEENEPLLPGNPYAATKVILIIKL
jgi:dTDP-D-glucose 4,6-dehydratase